MKNPQRSEALDMGCTCVWHDEGSIYIFNDSCPILGLHRQRSIHVKANRMPSTPLPTNSADRKAVPMATGVLDYFPAALAEVAKVSKAGNDKHNPGQPMHHARSKSTDHADSLLRHLVDRGGIDPDTGVRHSAEVAWRALALLQQELEDVGLAPLARGAVLPIPTPEGHTTPGIVGATVTDPVTRWRDVLPPLPDVEDYLGEKL